MKKRGTTLSSVVLRPSLKTADNCWLFGSGSFWCKEVFFLSFFFLSFISILVFVRVCLSRQVLLISIVSVSLWFSVLFSSFCVCFSFLGRPCHVCVRPVLSWVCVNGKTKSLSKLFDVDQDDDDDTLASAVAGVSINDVVDVIVSCQIFSLSSKTLRSRCNFREIARPLFLWIRRKKTQVKKTYS